MSISKAAGALDLSLGVTQKVPGPSLILHAETGPTLREDSFPHSCQVWLGHPPHSRGWTRRALINPRILIPRILRSPWNGALFLPYARSVKGPLSLPQTLEPPTNCSNFFFKDFIYLFLERGEEREKERERNIIVWLPLTCPLWGTWPTTQACALTGV